MPANWCGFRANWEAGFPKGARRHPALLAFNVRCPVSPCAPVQGCPEGVKTSPVAMSFGGVKPSGALMAGVRIGLPAVCRRGQLVQGLKPIHQRPTIRAQRCRHGPSPRGTSATTGACFGGGHVVVDC